MSKKRRAHLGVILKFIIRMDFMEASVIFVLRSKDDHELGAFGVGIAHEDHIL
jgi:hypothetical protein